jgi:hypothetical protein
MFEWADRKSVIKPKLKRRANGPNYWYRLQFVDTTDTDHTWVNTKLDKRIDWVGEKLKDWPDCHRTAWDMWDFKHRKDAEKFITVFHLSWAQ